MQLSHERKAATQLKSWLKAVDIPFVDYSSYILVTKRNKCQVPLCFNDQPLLTNRIVINTKDIVNKKIKDSLDFFVQLQKRLGYAPKMPVSRGKLPKGKSNDFDLVALRHHELHKCPNPDPKKLLYYRPVIDIAVRKFVRDNSKIIYGNSMDTEDINTYAQMWTINFIGLHELPVRGDDQNKRLLMEYLKQRLSDLIRMVKNRMNVKIFDSDIKGTTFDDNFEQEEESEVPIKSKKEFARLLDQKLNDLDHDQLVETLLTAAKNDHIHFDAQKEASKRLHAHSLVCDKCKDLELPIVGWGDLTEYNNRPIVDQNGVIYDNPNDAAEKLGLVGSNIRCVLNGKYRTTGGYTFKYFTGSTPEADQEIPAEPL